MSLHKNIGNEEYYAETGDGNDDVSYTPEEVGTENPEEKSDAELIASGEIEIDTGKDEVFIDPNSSYITKTEEEKKPEGEEVKVKEVKKEEKKEEKPPEKKETGEEKPVEKEVKKEVKKTGEVSPEVEKLAKRFSQKRINKISREKFTLRDENEKLKQQLKELEQKSREANLIKERAEHSIAKPKAEDFTSDAEFYEALGRWSAKDDRLEHEASKKPVEVKPSAEEKLQQSFENIRDKILSDGDEKYEDFAEIVLKTDGSIVITPEMILAAGDSDNAADIFYYLGQHPEESHRIAGLNGAQIAREMGKIESQFLVKEVETHTPDQDSEFIEKSNPKKAQPEIKKVSSPPPPVKPIGGGGKTIVDLDKAGMSDYATERGFVRDGSGGFIKKRVNT